MNVGGLLIASHQNTDATFTNQSFWKNFIQFFKRSDVERIIRHPKNLWRNKRRKNVHPRL